MTLKELIADRIGVNILMIEDCTPDGLIYRYYGKQFITHSDLSTYEWTGGDNHERNDSSIHVEKLLKGVNQTWSSECLPPVGTVCEYYSMRLSRAGTWEQCVMLGHGTKKVLIRTVRDNVEHTCDIDAMEFRPIQTPREKSIDVIRKLLASCTMETAPEVIYNAIVSGAIKHEVN